MHEESPEGGRFKKEVFINDQSYLLLIRDEGSVPEAQVCHKINSSYIMVFNRLSNNRCIIDFSFQLG